MQGLLPTKPQTIFTRILFILYALLLGMTVFGGIAADLRYAANPLALLLPVILFVFTCLFFGAFLQKYAVQKSLCFHGIAGAACVLLFACNVAAGLQLRYAPLFDLEAIYQGAIAWAETGSFTNAVFESASQEYFYMFPNNLGGMTLLFVFFKFAALFRITDFFAVAVCCNSLLIACTVNITAQIARRLYGNAAGLLVLFFVLMSPPFYFMGAVFYTDTLAMLFPVLAFYLYLRAHESDTYARRTVRGALCGLCLAMGAFIKFTVLIAGIAMLIHAVCTLRKHTWKQTAVELASAILCIALLFAVRDAYFYSRHMNRADADRQQIPLSHWVMMGLGESGGYSPDDYAYTRSFATLQERDTAARAEIRRRIGDHGGRGLVSLFYTKGKIAFGDGTYELNTYLDDRPVYDAPLHALLLPGGAYYPLYEQACTAAFFGVQLLALAGAVRTVCAKRADFAHLVPHLCVLGVLLFLCMWEISGRYVLHFLPVLLLCAVR